MKITGIAALCVVALLTVFGWRWYQYVTNDQELYDEMGIELNSRMPQPLRKWGCDRLYQTFGNALPPMGCESEADPRQWM